ncbi:hypothetical protein LTR84_003059 [Exophiala bonariae]|uniref:Uncharacterized protein n=1 Tax=Exophiala bonariae TaxID=1690606 RepID=A0AAV9N9Y5_9EURO|nr:hypothetical protein LTR84_003059 [Exophiala bonariae]
MVAWENLVKMIVGRGSAEKSEQRQLDRQYKHVEEMNRNTNEVTRESPFDIPSPTPSITTRYTSPNPSKTSGSLRSARPTIYMRCASSPTIPTLTTFKSLDGPPDITARDLTHEELKRNYSQGNVWNVHEQPLPPMPQLSGFGRFRRSIDATTEWQMEHLDRHFADCKGLFANQFGDLPPAGLDLPSWRMYRAQHSRTASAASTRSSEAGRYVTRPEEYLDIKTGTRISRGFCPSTTSSANSSFKEGYGYHRRDSNLSSLSMTSPTSDVDQKFVRRTSRPASSRRVSQQGSTASMSGLGSIMESQEALPQVLRKLEKPCEFDEMGNNENAVASDDDDDEEDEGSSNDWSDVLEFNGANRQSNLTKGLQQLSMSKAGPNAKPVLTRQRTISDDKNGSRGLKRTIFERTKSRKPVSRISTHPQLHKKPTAVVSKLVKDKVEQTLSYQATSPTASGISQHIEIPKKRTGTTFSQSSGKSSCTSPTPGTDGFVTATPSPEHVASHILASTRSDTSHETLFIGGLPKEGIHTPCRGRYRSGTATTIRPGHSVEGDL